MHTVDLETFSKENKGKCPPKGMTYKIKVDREKYDVSSETILGKEILERAGKTPYQKFQLNQKMSHGQVKKIEYDEIVDLTSPGIERFMTIPLDQTEGVL